MSNIVIIDSPMGSGKTTWAINNLLNPNPLENYIYITPFLSEIDRVINATKDHKHFRAPENKGDGKIVSLNNMLLNEDDIAATHELFKHLNSESHEYIQRGNYTLILDEVLDVISPYNIKQDALRVLFESDWATIDEEGFLVWNEDVELTTGDDTFEEVKRLAENRSLICVNQKILLWRYPPEVFSMFNKIYILTYLFEASILSAYFKFNNIEYTKNSVLKDDNGEYTLCDFEKYDASSFSSLINIYDGELNENIQQKKYSLSKQWYLNSENNQYVKKLKDNIYNYVHNLKKAKANEIMWTCFKDDFNRLKGKGYSNSFVSCNCRSTNEYSDRRILVYTLNRYLNPGIPAYFSKKGVEIDSDLYALAEMLQWIWRSQIRNGKPIDIYIPSNRMRNLLSRWLRGIY